MDVNDLKGLFVEVNKRMNVALDHLKHEFGGVRTGRAREPRGTAPTTPGAMWTVGMARSPTVRRG